MKGKALLAISVLSACVLGAFSPAVEAETILRAPRAVTWKDFLGVNVQFHYFPADIYPKQMNRLDQLGLNWIRWTLHWPILEPAPGQYNLADLDAAMAAARPHDYRTVAYLVGSATFDSTAPQGASNADQYPPRDIGVFAERMTALAQRYPQVSHWQVWNEPNIIWLPQADPVAYYNLLTTTASAIRSAVPGKPIVTAGVAYYGQMRGSTGYMLQSMVDQGLARQDIVAAYHPYSEYPEGDSIQDRDFLVRATSLNKSLHDAGVSQVWATEWGWSSYAGPVEMQHIVGLDGQADYTLRRLALMSTLDYQRIFLFNLSDLDQRASARDRGYGLLDLNAEPKPVYTALKRFFEVTGPTLQPADPPPAKAIPEDLYAVAWNRPDGTHLLMAWSASSGHLNFPGIKSASLHDPLTGKRTELADSKGVDVPLTPTLQILAWKP
ncbi:MULTISPECIES: beta-xylosidase [unclassified Pseudomonas]|uniref:beta-xylosidase n=1 Tax=unclassified Pseudomonas TaxID=196821 RepID=UPI000D3620A4|nr:MULTISPECIES: beta-xylosidase [unclassified Pseudomonas]RAU44339.1 beta-xylosidase [Pseudomonas sp. RIT 409]RAU51014.1 beta-xylosidase [Pseudomonas sp. RIT 412]